MEKLIVIVIILFLAAGITALFALNRTASRTIPADDPNIVYSGRVDFTDPKVPKFDWPGVEIRTDFTGAHISAVMDDGGNDYNVIIDGRQTGMIETRKGVDVYLLAKGLKKGRHSLVLVKRTEAYDGVCRFRGFIVDKDAVVTAPEYRTKHRIEFIGDSLTVGYGIEGPGVECAEGTERKYKNNYKAFDSIVSRELGAEFHVIAVSGRGVVRNYAENGKVSELPLPHYYENTLMNDDLKKWDFRSWVPDIVVIYLGSNDFSTRPNPDKEVFISEYLKLLNKVRGYYSGARIFCIEGQQQEPFSEYLKIILNKFGDKKTSTILFSPVDKLQLGCDWHPNADAQKKMAEELLAGMIKAGI